MLVMDHDCLDRKPLYRSFYQKYNWIQTIVLHWFQLSGLREFLVFNLFIVVKDEWRDISVCGVGFFEAVMREGRRDVVVFVERRRTVIRVPEVGLVYPRLA